MPTLLRLITLILITMSTFFYARQAFAQTCGGSVTCCIYGTVCTPTPCGGEGQPACSCSIACIPDTIENGTCVANASGGCNPTCFSKTLVESSCGWQSTDPCPGAGNDWCGGCISACRSTTTQTCQQQINAECGGSAPTPGPGCTPYCGAQCGQGDGCGGLCGSSHVGTPPAPEFNYVINNTNYDSVEGLYYFRTANDDGKITVDFTANGWNSDLIQYQFFPVDAAGNALTDSSNGLDRCDHTLAKCDTISMTSTLQYSVTYRPKSRYYRMRLRQRSGCGTWSAWRNRVFRIDGLVTGFIMIDNTGNAAQTGSYGTCAATGATAFPNSSMTVTTDGNSTPNTDTAINATSGRYRTWIPYENAGNPTPGGIQITLNNIPAGFSVICPPGGAYTAANSDLGAPLMSNGTNGVPLDANFYLCAGGSSAPTPTNLSPASGTNLSGDTAAISWSPGSGGSASDRYDIHVVAAGDVATVQAAGPNSVAHCSWAASTGARCSNNQAALTYNYTRTNGIHVYAYRVRAISNTCGSQTGTWSAWTYFGFTSNITGNFYLDPNDAAYQPTPGALCVSGGGTSLNSPGTGASITSLGVDGATRNATIAGSSYSVFTYTWNPGNNTLNFTPGTDGFGRQYVVTCPDSGSDYLGSYSGINSPSTTANFFFREDNLVNGSWFQTRGGNAYAGQTSGTALQSHIPTVYCTTTFGCIPYILAEDLGSVTDSAGIALTGGGAVDSTSDAGNSGTNINERSTQAAALGTIHNKLQENYDYFYRQFSLGLNPSDDFASSYNNASEPSGSPANGKLAYFRNGDLTIQQTWTISSSEKKTIFVNGDLRIRDSGNVQQLITVAQGGFLSFIVSGDIIFEASVNNNTVTNITSPNVAGVFIADGQIIVESFGIASGGDYPFVGAGTFVGWNGVTLSRDYDDGGSRRAENNDKPVETFIFRPDLVLNAPNAMMRSSYIWQETN